MINVLVKGAIELMLCDDELPKGGNRFYQVVPELVLSSTGLLAQPRPDQHANQCQSGRLMCLGCVYGRLWSFMVVYGRLWSSMVVSVVVSMVVSMVISR
jgi:hypothetical protein